MSKLEQIIIEIKKLERELLAELELKQEEYSYVIRNRKVQFERETREYHRALATRLHIYFAESSLLTILTAPIIWACLIPAIFLDVFVSVYHAICFRIYGIPLVRRSDYIVVDRHSLQYLNLIEKLNCVYCGYFNGLIAYVQEIAARTEQYWCPIKHARRMNALHSRYHRFFEFGDGELYQKSFAEMRKDFDDLDDRT